MVSVTFQYYLHIDMLIGQLEFQTSTGTQKIFPGVRRFLR